MKLSTARNSGHTSEMSAFTKLKLNIVSKLVLLRLHQVLFCFVENIKGEGVPRKATQCENILETLWFNLLLEVNVLAEDESEGIG